MTNNEPTRNQNESVTQDPEIDELVAYLDGELDDASSARIAARLDHDAVFRHKLEQLRSTWELLDVLPRAKADRRFAKTTVEMVAVNAERDAESTRSLFTKRRSTIQFASGVVVLIGLLGGFYFTRLLVRDPDAALLADLPVIENIELISHVDNVDFLRSLLRNGLFVGDVSDEASDERLNASLNEIASGDDNIDKRRQRVATLSDSEKENLRRKYERYESLRLEDRERLQQLITDLTLDDQRQMLQSVLIRYGEWLNNLSSTERADLADRGTTERIPKIKEILTQQEIHRVGPLAGLKLKSNDIETIVVWLDDYLQRNEQTLIDGIPPEARNFFARIEDPRRKRFAMYKSFVHFGAVPQAIQPSETELDELAKKLSPEAQAMLRENKDPKKRYEVEQEWLKWIAFWRSAPPIAKEELERFFNEKMSAEDRERLERMPAAKMREELTKLYMRDRFRPGWNKGQFRTPNRPPNSNAPKSDPKVDATRGRTESKSGSEPNCR